MRAGETGKSSHSRQTVIARRKPLDAKGLFYLGLSLLEAKQPAAAMKALQEALDAGLSPPLSEEARRSFAKLKKA